MIRNLLATTALATLVATGAFAQTDTTQPDASGSSETMQPAPETGAAPADSSGDTAQDPAASGDASTETAQDPAAAPAEETAQDPAAAPTEETAQDPAAAPADDTAQTPPASGDDAQTAASGDIEVEGHLASNLIGESVYNGTADDAEMIGEINDIVIGNDGKAEFAVIGVGGFLGIGEKDVAIEYATLQWAERDGDMWLVVETTKEQLEQQPAFDRTAYDPEAAAAEQEQQAATDPAATEPAGTTTVTPTPAPSTDTTAEAPAEEPADDTAAAPAEEPADTATTEQPAADNDATTAETTETAQPPADDQATAEAPATEESTDQDMAAAPADDQAATDTTETAAIDRSTLQPLEETQITAENLVGTTVYGANEENIGEIGDVVLEGENVDAVLVDVGGFLGMGEKTVAIGMDNLQFMTDDDGNRYLYTEFTQEQLEAQPAYDESTYAENRDTMRMTVQN